MRAKRRGLLPGLVVLGLLAARPAFPQAAAAGRSEADVEALKKQAIKVFISCDNCDLEYIKTEITFVNYVRDRNEAGVHVLITTQSTGSGGREYALTFIGQNGYADVQDLQKYYTEKDDTDDAVRQGLVKVLKLGLLSFVARTPIAARIDVGSEPESKSGPIVDRWNSWLFSLSGNGWFNGEQTYSSRSVSLNLSANRVTEASKLRLGYSISQNGDEFRLDEETIKSEQDYRDFSGLYVLSLSDHWSAGIFAEAESSTYSNTDLDVTLAPAVEFNLYPYSQSSRRQLRFLYMLAWSAVRYRETTIYDKIRENLWKQSLSVSLSLKEKWGSATTTLSGQHYFHDVKKYNLDLFTILNLNVYKGLSVYLIGGGSRIRDQLALPKGDLTFEEVLLQRKQLATTYSYFFAFGVSFTFGSIYTNVVNPRFGRLSGSSMSVSYD